MDSIVCLDQVSVSRFASRVNTCTEPWAQCASPPQLRNISYRCNPWRLLRNRPHRESQLRQMSKASRDRLPLRTLFIGNALPANPVLRTPLRALLLRSPISLRAQRSTKTREVDKTTRALHPLRYPAIKTSHLWLLRDIWSARNRGNTMHKHELFCQTSLDPMGNNCRRLTRTTPRYLSVVCRL